jgi:hypothetical protein
MRLLLVLTGVLGLSHKALVLMQPRQQPKMPRQIQFIVSSGSAELDARARQLSRAHAARQTHATKRRLRLQEYEEERGRSQQKPDVELVPRVPGPLDWVLGCGRDPFVSFARSLTDQEHFLLDHCTS